MFCRVTLLVILISETQSAKILGVFPSPGYSQFILCESLMKHLASRGHQVTVISPFQPQTRVENFKTILVEGLQEFMEKRDRYEFEQDSVYTKIKSIYNFGSFLSDYLLSRDGVKDLIISNETFDLVIVEHFYNEAHMGFAKYFNAPLVIFSSIAPSEWSNHLIGNINLPSVVPIMYSDLTTKMSFLQRFQNTIYIVYEYLYKQISAFPNQQKIMDKYFPIKMNLKEIMYNASLMLMNSHPVVSQAFLTPPSMIEIGGFHIRTEKLPKKMQEFLDGAKYGAIYISMGTNLKGSRMSREKIDYFVNVIRKIRQRVLWKFEEEYLIQNKPENLLLSKWFPQNDILQHLNTIVFVSHGGIISVIESIYAGVPIIGIPIFFDQKMNIAKVVEQEIGILLPFNNLEEKTLNKALDEVINNPKYARNVLKRSSILKDQLVGPLDRAAYWIEFVLKHKDVKHLKHNSSGLNWFQFYLLDIIVSSLFSFLISIYLVKLTVSRLSRLLNGSTKEKQG